MKMDRILSLLEIERKCVSSNCDRKCETCELVQDQNELIEMYDNVILHLRSSSAIAHERNNKWYCGNCGCRITRAGKARFCAKCGIAVLRPRYQRSTEERQDLDVG